MNTTITVDGKDFTFRCRSEMTSIGVFLTFKPDTGKSYSDLAEMVLCKMAYMLEHGIPDAYGENIDDFMTDLHMDLPWNENESLKAEEYIRHHEAYGYLKAKFENKYPGCDFIVQ